MLSSPYPNKSIQTVQIKIYKKMTRDLDPLNNNGLNRINSEFVSIQSISSCWWEQFSVDIYLILNFNENNNNKEQVKSVFFCDDLIIRYNKIFQTFIIFEWLGQNIFAL